MNKALTSTLLVLAVSACGGMVRTNGTTTETGSSGTTSNTGATSTATAGSASWAGLVEPANGTWSLQEREYWNALNEELAGYVRDARQNCGVDIVASYEHETFRGRMTEGGTYGLTSFDRNCVSVVQMVRDICVQGGLGLQAIQAANGPRRLICAHGPMGYSLEGGVGRVSFNENYNGMGWPNEWSEYIKSHL